MTAPCPDILSVALLIIAAYLVGAIPFGLILGRLHGIDVRAHGSRNIGATNVGRVLGRKWGFLCLALDILKGAAPTLAARFVIFRGVPDQTRLILWMGVGLAAVLGHVFPVYLRFRGGKGVATTIGVGLAVYPFFTFPLTISLAGYAIARWATGLVSVGSLTIAVLFPTLVFGLLHLKGLAWRTCWPLQITAILLGGLIIVRHSANIRRLLSGKEIPPALIPANPQRASSSEGVSK
jgi:glycerol-3-phosphate acyltransferase PlsY